MAITVAMLIFVLANLLMEATATINCSIWRSGTPSQYSFNTAIFSCGPNGCCAKGCVRSDLGRCVAEDCTGSLTGWLRRPVTVSCYFHWFLILLAGLITVLMTVLALYAMGLKMRNWLRARFNTRYRPILNVRDVSVGSTPC